jgi:hypothetical protein
VGVGGSAGSAELAPEGERFASAAAMVMARLNFIFMLLETSFVACFAPGDHLAMQVHLRAIQDFRRCRSGPGLGRNVGPNASWNGSRIERQSVAS